MRPCLSLLIACLASQSVAQQSVIGGQMICDVVGTRLVTNGNEVSSAAHPEGFALGATFTFEYVLNETKGLSVFLGDRTRDEVLIDEEFPSGTFRGVSRFINVAEYRGAYSEVSFGRFGMNYKGSDQFFVKNECNGEAWSGHFVQTYVSGHYTQVVSLDCRPFIEAADDVLARLEGE